MKLIYKFLHNQIISESQIVSHFFAKMEAIEGWFLGAGFPFFAFFRFGTGFFARLRLPNTIGASFTFFGLPTCGFFHISSNETFCPQAPSLERKILPLPPPFFFAEWSWKGGGSGNESTGYTQLMLVLEPYFFRHKITIESFFDILQVWKKNSNDSIR